jgi:DNA-binding MarR family transcriptional regulator/GNAT superfamily N-acetyltransferase
MSDAVPPLDRGPLLERQAGSVRAFNRFYTRLIGLLEEGQLKSPYSLSELRVLYELDHREGLTAAGLGRDLGLDAGYLSRILKKFETKGILERLPSAEDGRQSLLALTPAGRAAFAPLNAESQKQIAALLAPLTAEDRAAVVEAMARIQCLLGDGPAPKVSYILRPPEPGDVCWAVSRQAALYTREYGWDGGFETLVAEIAAKFLADFDASCERCWIAEREGKIVGSVFLVKDTAEVAKLRMLYVDPEARGLGIGKRLVKECIRFARTRGYRSVTLWTNDILVAARGIYEAAGFTLVEEEPHHSFGKDLVGQYWTLTL